MKKVLILFIIGLLAFNPLWSQQKKETRFPEIETEAEEEAQTPVVAEARAPMFSPETLPFFGHKAFTITEEMLKNYPTGGTMFPENYRLGPGDHLGVYLLGKFQQTFDIIVNAEGKVFIPTVGVFNVSDLTIEEFHTFLEKQLARYYEHFSLNIMLIEPKKIPVMVVGEVNRPGKYFLSSLNTVPDAVVMAGGPTSNGSLRNIQIYRGDQLLTTTDLYQFLMTGKIENETFLQRNDRIIVPVLDAVVTVSGEVKRQARFELKHEGKERLSDAIYLAGGFRDLAYLDKIEISRLLPTGERTVFYVNYHQVLADENSPMNIVLNNEDFIHVYSVQEQTYPKYVYIQGEVKRPGQYPLEHNLRVLDLILKAGNLTRSAYTLQCELAKIDPNQPVTYIKINLERLLAAPQSEENYLLEEDDRLFIRRIPEWEVGWTVEVKGEVQFPGVY
ncbi:MAG: SLBB domain-containing protein, partial [candidate division KSB1 bacterium]|nr:SLBB domain-containing protein [candidate division KSB1 bacterium]